MTDKPTGTNDSISRRSFLQRTSATAAVVAAPLVIPARLLGKDAPSNRVRVGHIGAGRIAQGHDMVGVAGADLADVLAVADLDSKRAASGKTRVERLFVDVELGGEWSRGQTVVDHLGVTGREPNVDVVLAASRERFVQRLHAALT